MDRLAGFATWTGEFRLDSTRPGRRALGLLVGSGCVAEEGFAMPQWRTKRMRVSEWAQFQQAFGEYHLLDRHGDPDLALFVKSAAGSDSDEVYVTGPDLDAIERLSPGGWTDCPAPSGEGIMLLAGTGDSWTHLGVRRQSPDGS